jgi:DNA-binding transcriptional LysR family regulator
MDLRQMEYVVAVAEEGGFSAAARRLHVVQSAVSGTVRTLEHELGAQLFLRTTHRVSLTSEGEAFVPAARAALQAADQARAAVDLVRGELRGEVRIGVMQGLYTGLPQALARFRQEHPAVVVRLRQAQADQIPHALREGTLDLAVVALDRPQHRGLATRLLAEEEIALITAPNRALPTDRPLALAEAGALPLVEFPVGWAIRDAVDRAFRAAGVDRTTTFEVNDVLAATDLVRHDLGACFLPLSVATRFPELAFHRISEPAPVWRLMTVRTHGEAPPAVAALLRHIR